MGLLTFFLYGFSDFLGSDFSFLFKVPMFMYFCGFVIFGFVILVMFGSEVVIVLVPADIRTPVRHVLDKVRVCSPLLLLRLSKPFAKAMALFEHL